MPKMKTHRGAAKRFKVTGTGKIMRRKAVHEPHPREEAPTRKRRLGGEAERRRRRRATASSACSALLGPRRATPTDPTSRPRKEPPMARVKRAVHSKKHRRAILERAKGYYGNKSRSYRAANEQVMHSLQYAFRDRRARKGEFRKLWIQRINAACRLNGISYSRFIAGLQAAEVEVDRKVLADLAVAEPEAFAALVEVGHRGRRSEAAGLLSHSAAGRDPRSRVPSNRSRPRTR